MHFQYKLAALHRVFHPILSIAAAVKFISIRPLVSLPVYSLVPAVLLSIQGSSSPGLHFITLGQRLTFPFPFVHLQPLDGKLEELLTVETKSHIHGEW